MLITGLVVLFVVLQIVDYVSTVKAIRSGKGKEGNPILSKLFKSLKPEISLLLVKAFISGLVIFAYISQYLVLWVLIVINIFYFFIAVNNIKLLKK